MEVDLIDAFPASGDPKQFWASPEDAHPNDKANELMAAMIEATLRGRAVDQIIIISKPPACQIIHPVISWRMELVPFASLS
jgi:hypothetical protein